MGIRGVLSAFSRIPDINKTAEFLKRRRLFSWILLSVILLSLFAPAYRIMRMDKEKSLFDFTRNSDFEDYYNASVYMSRGEDLYHLEELKNAGRNFTMEDLSDPARMAELARELREVGTYLYPPLTAFLLLPLSGLEYPAAAAVYQTASIAAFLVFLLVLYRLHGRKSEELFFIPLIFSLLFLYQFLLGNFMNGNILTFLILLCGAGILLSFSENIYASAAGGMLIGISVMIKVTPVFFVLVLIAKRRMIPLFASGAGLLIGLLFPAFYTGWERNLSLFAEWMAVIPASYGDTGIVRPWANNQSISAMIGKFFIPGSDVKQALFGLPFFSDGTKMPRSELIVFGYAVKGLNFLFMLFGFFLSAYFFFFRPKAHNGKMDMESVYLIGIFTLLSLLVSGVSWYHSYGILFFPVFYRMLFYAEGVRFNRGEKGFLALLFVFGTIYSAFPGIAKDFLSLYSVFAAGIIGAFAAGAFCLMRGRYGL